MIVIIIIIIIIRTFNFNGMGWWDFPSTINTDISFSSALKLPLEHSILAAGAGGAACYCRHLHGTSYSRLVSLSQIQPE